MKRKSWGIGRLGGGDNLDEEEWDRRGWTDHASVREQLVFLAAEACLEMGR